MAKYIPLDAVLAKIDKVMAEEMFFYETACKEGDEEVSSSPMVYTRLQMLRSTINTLEVKEVDLEHLEQEVKDFCYEYDDRKEKWYELCPNDRKLLQNPTWANFAMSIAKHFFELGLKAQKGE